MRALTDAVLALGALFRRLAGAPLARAGLTRQAAVGAQSAPSGLRSRRPLRRARYRMKETCDADD